MSSVSRTGTSTTRARSGASTSTRRTASTGRTRRTRSRATTPPVQSANASAAKIPTLKIAGFDGKNLKLRSNVGRTPSAGSTNTNVWGAGTRNGSGAYSRGKIEVKVARSDAKSFLVKVDTYHTQKKDPITLTLQARVQDGKKEALITLGVLADNEVWNKTGYKAGKTFRINYADINEYLKKLNPKLKLAGGEQLAVLAVWPGGHTWGGYHRAGTFYVPAPGQAQNVVNLRSTGSNSSGPKWGAEMPLDISAKIPSQLATQYKALPKGGMISTRLESEYKAQTTEKSLEAAIVKMYKMAANKTLAEKVLGKGWVVKPVTRYWRKDKRGRVIGSKRLTEYKKKDPALAKLTLGDPDPMLDEYKDNAQMELLKREAVVRVRSNEQKKGLLNIKAGKGRIDNKTGIRQRIEIGVELARGAKDADVQSWLTADWGMFNIARKELNNMSGSISLYGLFDPVLSLKAERHRFAIENVDPKSPYYGVEVEWTGDITSGKSVRAAHQKNGKDREATIYGFEMELNHLQLASANVARWQQASSITDFTTDGAQKKWTKSLSTQASLAAPPRFHTLDDLKNSAFRKTDSYKAFEGVVGKLKKHLFPRGVRKGYQKAASLAKEMKLIRLR